MNTFIQYLNYGLSSNNISSLSLHPPILFEAIELFLFLVDKQPGVQKVCIPQDISVCE